MWYPIALLAVLLGATASRLPAQYLNRAAFLGIGEEGFERSYRQGPSYFLSRLRYATAPPWSRDSLNPFTPGVDYAFGSVTGSEFTVEGSVRYEALLDPDGPGDWRFTYDVLQSEHQDARFLKNTVGFEVDLNPRTALFAQGEVVADKSLIDVSVGAHLLRAERGSLRLMATAVDMPHSKSQTVQYRREPYALMASGWIADATGRAELGFELGAQLPTHVTELDTGQTLGLERYIGKVEGRLRLCGTDALTGSVHGEFADKTRQGAGSGARSASDHQLVHCVGEWSRDLDGGWKIAAGASVVWLRADGRQAGNGGGLDIDREEWYGIGRLNVPLSEQWSMEPHLVAGHASFYERDGALAPRQSGGFRGEFSANFRYVFSERSHLTFLLSAELHQSGFGGGGAHFVTRF